MSFSDLLVFFVCFYCA